MAEWELIETYPVEMVIGDGWGPEVVVKVPNRRSHIILNGVPQPEFDVGETHYVAHLEADMWLVRDATDPISWSELPVAPTHWMKIS